MIVDATLMPDAAATLPCHAALRYAIAMLLLRYVIIDT